MSEQAQLRRAGYAPKLYHRADKMGPNGEVSALCYVRPRAIDLKRTSWTLRDEAVTCPRCLKVLSGKK